VYSVYETPVYASIFTGARCTLTRVKYLREGAGRKFYVLRCMFVSEESFATSPRNMRKLGRIARETF